MSRIRILTERVANQIAAGEVVERPAAAVKELVENALDAGATRIDVAFRQAGRELIRVEDDGRGMDRDDAVLALQRHATSKISEATDLDQLATFGFRGEALPSIASVSRFMLQTRTAEEEEGTEVTVNAGKVLGVRGCGRPVGTAVEASHLFHPVPARRRFLKSDATESGHIVQVVRGYALAFPQVRFALVQDGRTIFQSPQCPSLEERVGEIFGRQLADALVPIEASQDGWTLTGLIGRPGVERSGRQDLVTFVNRRPVESRTLNYAVIESYRESLPKGRYPAAFLFLTCPPAAVDVNVHPTKREIRFRNEGFARGFVIESVRQRLRELGAAAGANLGGGGAAVHVAAPSVVPAARPPTAEARPAPPAASIPLSPLAASTWSSPAATTFARDPGPAVVPSARESARAETPGSGVVQEPAVPVGAATAGASAGWRWLGTAHGTYAVFETGAGLVLVDRRAALERVWCERLEAEFRAGATASQRLLLPVTLELDPITSALLLDGRAFFAAHGFEVAEFGRNFFRIEAVPEWIEPAQAEPFLRDLLTALREGRLDERRPELARAELARLAAARSTPAPGDASEAEVRRLLAALFATRLPLTSPAGRPTFIELGWGELARRFGR